MTMYLIIERVSADINNAGLCGNYEKETACQFKQAVFYICNYYFYEL